MGYEFEFDRLLKEINNSLSRGIALNLAELTKEFNTPVQSLVKSGWVSSNCSDILFINLTPLTVLVNGNVTVNNYPLRPGDFVGWMGNNAEINKDTYVVNFESAATSVIVLKKLYTMK